MKHAMPARVKRGLSILLVLTMLFALLTPVSAAAANTAEQTVELQVGESKTLRLSGWQFGTTWNSSDEAVATVSSRGTVTAAAPGTATITAASRGLFGFGRKTTTFTVVVTEAEAPTPPETPETPEAPEEETLTVKVNETLELSVDADGGEVTWASSDETIATVDGEGLVTGISEGNVTITATVKKTTGRFWFFWWGGTTTTTTEFAVIVLPADEEPVEPDDPDEPVDPDEPEIEGTYTVTFDTNGGSEIEAQTIYAGECAYRPADPTKEGSVFDDWYADKELTEKYDFAQPVEENITIYARWTEMTTAIELNDGGYGTWVVNRTITGSVASNADIEEITYKLINGETEIASDTIELEEDGGFAVSVLLQDGTNALTVSVKTADGTTTTKTVELTYDSGEIVETDNENLTLRETEQSAVEEASEEENAEEIAPTYYAANLLSIYFTEDTSFEARKDFVETTLGGQVAGYKNVLDMMQIWLPDPLVVPESVTYEGPTTLAEINAEFLQSYAKAIAAAFAQVEFVGVEIGFADGSNAVNPNDPWDGNGTTKDAFDTGAWWVEAIDLDDAWEYADYNNMNFFGSLKVGVVDNSFDLDHEDLPAIQLFHDGGPAADHGNHVAGIIGAIPDNGKGIAGVTNGQLWMSAYDDSHTRIGDKDIIWAPHTGVAELVENGTKVVNLSQGFKSSDSASIDTTAWQAKNSMEKLLDKGYDFIVVQAAGNSGKAFDKNGYYASIDPKETELLEHIIIVSNTMQDGMLEKSSNGGNGKNDFNLIAAPGTDIFSAYDSDHIGKSVTGAGYYGYGKMTGTSMAAPIVTGVCGLVWSVNPSLTGSEVVDIVMSTADGTAKKNPDSNAKGGMGIINALNAVKAAIESLPTYYGCITDATTGEGVANADITIMYFEQGRNGIYAGECTTDASGNFTMPQMAPGTYQLRIDADGYAFTIYNFGYNKDSKLKNVNLGNIAINPEMSEEAYRIVLTWNDTVADLDSHLLAETKSGETIHLYYATMHDNITQAANLDVDDTDYYGPETITITNISALKNIRYAVHDFSNHTSTSSKAMSGTEATVKVYKGSTLLNTFQISTNKGGTEWDVFAIDASGKIVPTNRMTYCEEPSAVLSGVAGASAASASAAAAGRAIVKK